MAYNIGTQEDPMIVYVSFVGGIVDAIVRAKDEASFIKAAKAAELLYEVTTVVTDESTGETVERGTGEWLWSKGVNIDMIGPVTIKEAVYDEKGDIITPPVLDTRYHANIRISSPSVDRVDADGNKKWHKWAYAWTKNGVDDATKNANENAKVFLDVALIDPDSIRSPSRVWL